MSVPIVNSAEDQARRLRHKTQDAHLAHLAVEGAGISLWEADVLVEVVNEVYFAEPEERPLQRADALHMRSDERGCREATERLQAADGGAELAGSG